MTALTNGPGPLPTAAEDHAAITDVLHRYATAVDQRDWTLFRTCWTDDIDAEYGTIGQFSTADALTQKMTRFHQPMGASNHLISNVVVEFAPDDSDRARVVSYVHAVRMLSPGTPAASVDVIGSYEDVFVRTADGWRIRGRTFHLTRLVTNQPV